VGRELGVVCSCSEALSSDSVAQGFVELGLEIASVHMFSDKDVHNRNYLLDNKIFRLI